MRTEKPRVLVVEDQFLVGELIASLLQDYGFSAIGPAGSIEEALAHIEQESLCGAVLDCHIRDGDVRKIAETLRAREVPYLIVTGLGVEALPEELREAPYLEKPIDETLLRREAERLFRPDAA